MHLQVKVFFKFKTYIDLFEIYIGVSLTYNNL